MKVVACSDAHLDARCCGVERFEEVAEGFLEAREYALTLRSATGEPVLFVFCGDLCDGDDGRDVLRASSFAIEQSKELGESGVDQLWVCGNHDVNGDGSTTLDPIAAADYARVARSPLVFELPIGRDSDRVFVPILALPYAPSPYDSAEELKGFLEASKAAPQRLVFHHLMRPGMHPGSESVEMAKGKDRMFPFDLLERAKPKKLTIVGGHYHRAQDGPHDFIVGSMARNTFGEQDNVPSFLVLDVTVKGVKATRVPFAGARKMISVGLSCEESEAAYGFVRVIPPDNSTEEAVASFVTQLREHGVLAVKVERTRRDAVVTKSERSDPGTKRSLREVVLGMAAEAVSRDRAALREMLEGVLDESGL